LNNAVDIEVIYLK